LNRGAGGKQAEEKKFEAFKGKGVSLGIDHTVPAAATGS